MTNGAARPPQAARQSARSIRATWMRGGTSKCWIFDRRDLPEDQAACDAFLVRLFGSPDVRQIDGIGGGTSTTSKALIVAGYVPEEDCVDYEFAQVSIDRATVERESNCGNCATGMGLYAVQERLVAIEDGFTRARLRNTVTGLVVETTHPTPGRELPRDGDAVVAGTVYPGSHVEVRFFAPSWSTYCPTLATGRAVDVFELDGRTLHATLVDAGAPCAFVRSQDLDIDVLSRSTRELEMWMPLLVKLRAAAADRMGIPRGDAALQSIPKVGIVSPSASPDCDLEARMVSMTAPHPSIGVTSAVALGAASGIEASTVHDAMGSRAATVGTSGGRVAVGTAIGPVAMRVDRGPSPDVGAVSFGRSARRLADATVYIAPGWQDLVGPAGIGTNPIVARSEA